MKQIRLVALLMAMGLPSCSTHQGLTPIQPVVGHYSPTVVESLSPHLKWQPDGDSGARYDLVIFETTASGKPGKSVYYREGLEVAEHKIDQPLKPDTNYYWTVRSRKGATVGDWSTYDHRLFVPIPFGFYYQGQESLMFPFRTPPPIN